MKLTNWPTREILSRLSKWFHKFSFIRKTFPYESFPCEADELAHTGYPVEIVKIFPLSEFKPGHHKTREGKADCKSNPGDGGKRGGGQANVDLGEDGAFLQTEMSTCEKMVGPK